MKNRLLAALRVAVLLCIASPVFSQTIQVFIQGGNELTCVEPQTILFGGVQGGVPPLTYNWTGPAGFSSGNAQTISVNQPGVYTLTVTSANGQSGSASVTVLANFFPPVFTLLSEPACNGCNGIIYAVASGGGGTDVCSFQWSNGSTSEVITNLCPGIYSVTVTDCSSGCPGTQIINLPGSTGPYSLYSDNPSPCNSPDSTGVAGPVACEKVCPGQTVKYTVYGQNSPTNNAWNWQIIGAASFTLSADKKTATVVWPLAGSGSVNLIFNNNPCQDDLIHCVEITEKPVAIIGSTPSANGSNSITVCEGQPVYFENQSLHAEFVEWNFGDFSQKSEAQNPTHAWPVAGQYEVRLIVKTACLCPDTAFLTVNVITGNSPTLDCIGTICTGTEVTYSASESCGSYAWQVGPEGLVLGGGGPTDDFITIQWTNGELGLISLTALACTPAVCPQPAYFQIPIISDDAQITGDQRICSQEESIYEISPFGGANFVWTLSSGGQIVEGQGTNRIKIKWTASPNAAVTHTLSVSYDNCYLECGGSDQHLIKILPKYSATGPLELCDNSSAIFNGKILGSGAAISLNWQIFSEQNALLSTTTNQAAPNLNFNFGAGQFVIKTTPFNPALTCTDEYELTIQTKAPPAAPTGISGENSICPGAPYTYEIAGSTPGNNVFWTAGFGAPATQQGENAVIIWAPNGPYSLAAKQVSADGLGCESAPVSFIVGKLPAPIIAGDPEVCAQTEADYSATAFQEISYSWTISPADAGAVSEGQGTNAVKIFWYSAGNHTVSVDACGQIGTFDVLVNALPEPIPVYPSELCESATDLISTTQNFTTFNWKSEDGTSISSLATLTVGPGAYEVEVTDANGCVNDSTFTIDPVPAPEIHISTPDFERTCPATLRRLIASNTDSGLSFKWFKNGSPIGTNSFQYDDSDDGIYYVVATNSLGCQSVSNQILLENCPPGGGQCSGAPGIGGCPGGSFDILPTAACNTREYLAQPLPGFTSATWILDGQGVFATGTNPTETFDESGYYKIWLLLEYGGVQCLLVKVDTVVATSHFFENGACPDAPFSFEERASFVAPASIAGWAWDFGDPASGPANNSTQLLENHLFTAPGNYAVSLTVTASTGCTAIYSENVFVQNPPQSTILEPATNCAGNALEFLATSSETDLATWDWNFNDPASGSANEATVNPGFHKFAAAGNYSIELKIKNIAGCRNTILKPQTIVPNSLSGNITPAPTSFCEGKMVTLSSPGGGTAWVWKNSAGDTLSTANSLTVNEEGNYSLIISDPNGCSFQPADAVVQMIPAPDGSVQANEKDEFGQINGVFYSPYTVCQGDDVFLAADGLAANYSFTWTGGVTGGENEFSEDRGNLLPAGTHTYFVTITDPTTGCTNTTDPFSVVVNPTPTNVQIQISPAGLACGHVPHTFSVVNPQATNTYLWNTGQGGAFFMTDESGLFSVVATNPFGCSATSNQIQVLPGAPIEAVPSGCHTRCSPDTICFTPPPTAASWQWFLNGIAVPAPGGTIPNLIATQSGTYTVLITDFWGCTAYSEPLTLDLQAGFGSIFGYVFSDVNGNNLPAPPDTTIAQIPVILWQNGLALDTSFTSPVGSFSFPNIAAGTYTVRIDTANLPTIWNEIIFETTVTISGCGEDLANPLNFLLKQCQPTQTVVVLQGCTGEMLSYAGLQILAGDSQTIVFQSVTGCDSIITIQTTALPTSQQTINHTVCQGESILFDGQVVAGGTSQLFIYQTTNGCDSSILVDVAAIALPPQTSLNLEACDSIFYENAWLQTGTTTALKFPSQLTGCDSTVMVTVNGLPGLSSSLNLTACPGDFADYFGTPVAAGQSQIFGFQSSQGCDSTVTVSVAELAISASIVNLAACPGDAAFFNGNPVLAGTSQAFILQNWLGCDSTVTVNVAEFSTSASTVNLAACPGDAAFFDGNPVLAGTSQAFILQNWLGCDSTVTVVVAEFSTANSTVNLSACTGESATFDGQQIAAGTSQVVQYQTVNGCDSLVTVNVSAIPLPAPTSLQINSCLPVFYGNQMLAVGSVTPILLQSAATGCDSTVTVSVVAAPPVSASIQLLVCPGDSIFSQNEWLKSGQTEIFSLQTALGCDSILTVSVNEFGEPQPTLIQLSACSGNTATWQNNQIPAGQTANFTLQTANGCDSLITVVVDELSATAASLALSVCEGQSIDYQGFAMYDGDVQTFTLTNAAGCDSLVTVSVLAMSAISFLLKMDTSCLGKPTGGLVVESLNGALPFEFSINGGAWQDSAIFQNLAAGPATLEIRDANGCEVEEPLQIPAVPLLGIDLADRNLTCDSLEIFLLPVVSGGGPTVSFEWKDGAGASLGQTLGLPVSSEGAYIFTAKNECETAEKRVEIKFDDTTIGNIFYAPNAFAPEGSTNSAWQILWSNQTQVVDYQAQVFDRWGNRVFETTDPQASWNGLYRDKKMRPGVFVWLVEATVEVCGQPRVLKEKGDITLIR